jgi:NADH-quinone oxidoreductase subunit L
MIAGAWICLLAPVAGAVSIVLLGGAISRRIAGLISIATTFVAFGGAVASFFSMWARDADDRSELSTAYTWLAAGSFDVGFSILVDPLSIVMMLVVSGVGGLIIWYSLGYMAGEDEERRYFAYMSLFVFAMLVLVEAGNFLFLLIGWGLVGLASYLLIGYYHRRREAVAAAKKAFVMNAVGDATMTLALFLLVFEFGTLDFGPIFEAAESGEASQTVWNLVALGLLGGAVAKSAQLPLQTWLPDAMEGPTPVSALIHAATMVTAGVYLIVRAHAVFEAAPDVQALAAILGALTLVLAGLIALVQQDIKRVIAYSTMSQIGYMFVGAGVGAYGFAMYHLVTHAFFKALLFLAAGIVIHHLAGEQDIRRMGGISRFMPFTNIAFLIGSLALVAIPPLSGFWTKDAILASALADGGALGWFLYLMGLAGALLTGLYAFRLYWIVFRGEPSELVLQHADEHPAHGTGEGPWSMVLPVGALTVLASIGGLLEIPGVWDPFEEWIAEVAEPLELPTAWEDYLTSGFAVLLGAIGIYIAWRVVSRGRDLVPEPRLRVVLEHKFYFDELYDALFYRPAAAIAARLQTDVETPVVEGSLTDLGEGTSEAASAVARAQTGYLRAYALVIAVSVVALAVVFLAVR